MNSEAAAPRALGSTAVCNLPGLLGENKSRPHPPTHTHTTVFVVKVDPSYAQPWQKLPQRSSSGSAFVLDTERRLIITNAHVVSVCTARHRV